jgi:DNA polymerase V
VPVSQKPVIEDFLAAYKRKLQRQHSANVAEVGAIETDGEPLSLPLYTSKVAAGFPSPADDHVEKRLNPNEYLVENDSATFFVRVKGDSMVDAGIFDNDVLVVDRSKVPAVGDIVLAVLDGEFTVKTLGHSKEGARLIPANSAYPIIEIKEGQSFEIFGVITGSMRKFK